MRPAIRRGTGCPYCAGNARKGPDDYHALAGTRGYTWFEPKVQNSNGLTTWRCDQGHCWTAPYNRLQKGNGCPVCAKRARRKDEAYRALARKRGLTWLGPDVPDRQALTNWRCPAQHDFAASFTDITQGQACPHCFTDSEAGNGAQYRPDRPLIAGSP